VSVSATPIIFRTGSKENCRTYQEESRVPIEERPGIRPALQSEEALTLPPPGFTRRSCLTAAFSRRSDDGFLLFGCIGSIPARRLGPNFLGLLFERRFGHCFGRRSGFFYSRDFGSLHVFVGYRFLFGARLPARLLRRFLLSCRLFDGRLCVG